MGCCGFRQAFPFDMTHEEKLIHKFEKDWGFEGISLDGFISSVNLPEMSVKVLKKVYESYRLRSEDLSNDSIYFPFYSRFSKDGTVSTKYICILAILLSSEFEILKAKLLFSLYNVKHLTLDTMTDILTDLTSVSLWILLAVPSIVLDKETLTSYYNQLDSVQKTFCIQKSKTLMQGKEQLDLEEFMEMFMKSFKTRYILKSSELRMYMMTRYKATHNPHSTTDMVDLKPTLCKLESSRPSYAKQKSVTFNDKIICYELQSQQQDEIAPEEDFKHRLRIPLSEEEGGYEASDTYDIENEEAYDILRFEDIIIISHTSNNSALCHDISDSDPCIDEVSVNVDRDDTTRWLVKSTFNHETEEISEEVKYGCGVILRNLDTKKYLSIENVSSISGEEYIITCQEKASENSYWIIEPAGEYQSEIWHPTHDIRFKHVHTGLYLCLDVQELENSEPQCCVIPSEPCDGSELWYIESKTVD